jgi:predicted Fe-Mo cluster-binding NifX family protein
MLIAVATSDQRKVDLHFGKASAFTLFEIDAESSRLVKEVAVAQYCTSDPNHTFHEQRFSAIAEALTGCRAVVCVQIGDLPRMSLAEAGIQAFTAQGAVEDALHNAFVLLSAGGC